MKFYSFHSQTERRKVGGSDFVELQFCKMKPSSKIGEIVDVQSIEHWLFESLYVRGDDMNIFYEEYGSLFGDGTYNNLKRGPMDLSGINYYKAEEVSFLVERIQAANTSDSETLLNWLSKVKAYNGFYILGV